MIMQEIIILGKKKEIKNRNLRKINRKIKINLIEELEENLAQDKHNQKIKKDKNWKMNRREKLMRKLNRLLLKCRPNLKKI